MAVFKPGDLVRFTRRARVRMFWARMQFGNGTQGGWAMRKHVREFRRCVGIVLGPTNYNNVPADHPDYDPTKLGPELDVRWLPSGLRYAYLPSDLEHA